MHYVNMEIKFGARAISYILQYLMHYYRYIYINTHTRVYTIGTTVQL